MSVALLCAVKFSLLSIITVLKLFHILKPPQLQNNVFLFYTFGKAKYIIFLQGHNAKQAFKQVK